MAIDQDTQPITDIVILSIINDEFEVSAKVKFEIDDEIFYRQTKFKMPLDLLNQFKKTYNLTP